MLATVCLDHEYLKLKKKMPDAQEEDNYRHLVKHNLPHQIPGSPSYFRSHLKNLLAVVKKKGLPTLFVTLTADEVSSTKWPECSAIEDIFTKVTGTDLPHTSMPVENACLFVHRVHIFFKECILGPPAIFGKVTNHVIRFEFQNRGSVHAHCLIWIHPDDQQSAANSIVANIPGNWNPNTEQYDPPDCDTDKVFYEQVMQKQQHRCRTQGCRKTDDGNCKYGFPCHLHDSSTPGVSSQTGIYQYFRPKYADRWTVPYHPLLLLLWNAHVDVQLIAQAAWSFYVLKYLKRPTLRVELFDCSVLFFICL